MTVSGVAIGAIFGILIVGSVAYNYYLQNRCPQGWLHSFHKIRRKKFNGYYIDTHKCRNCNVEVVHEGRI